MKNIKTTKKPAAGKKGGSTRAPLDAKEANDVNDVKKKSAGKVQTFHDICQPLTAINNYAQAGILVIENGGNDIDQLNGIFKKIWLQSLRAMEISKNMKGN